MFNVNINMADMALLKMQAENEMVRQNNLPSHKRNYRKADELYNKLRNYNEALREERNRVS
jgi:hypothetical protein